MLYFIISVADSSDKAYHAGTLTIKIRTLQQKKQTEVSEIRRIIVSMQNYVQCKATELALKNGGDFNVCTVEEPNQAANQCRMLAANIVLMEVTGYTPWNLEERMKIRDELRRNVPECRIVFFVDERAEKSIAGKIKQAKRDGLIDQFIFGSSSADFMVALLDTM